ncbi:MAG: YidC/Oxa1 family membrane protein insertase [Lachnospiraceae bacterium]|nr:YidC/Oxa1 family membrane protein insertase [Lachnospiraceae bacterium]
MIETLSTGGLVALAIGTRQPGMIVGPIAKFLGVIYNAVFNLIYGVIQSNSLGIAIILFTILVKVVLVPLMYKSQQSNYKMQKLQPEMNKIKKKFEGKKDAESQQKMALEMQKLQKDNNVNMMGGCLPMLIQLPILYALFYIFQQAYIYIDVVGANYHAIADVLISIPVQLRLDILTDMIVAHKVDIDVASTTDMVKLINMLTATEWNTVLTSAGDYAAQLTPLLAQKSSIETFMGISMISKVGFTFPGIIIPILAGFTTYLSTAVMTKKSVQSGGEDPSMQMMKSMNIMMPIMMGGMCITMPGGIGIYWTISNLIQVGQTVLLNKYFRSKDAKESKEVL